MTEPESTLTLRRPDADRRSPLLDDAPEGAAAEPEHFVEAIPGSERSLFKRQGPKLGMG